MTADYVTYHAAERPDAVAVIHNGRAVSFAEFSEDIHKVIGAVSALGVSRGGAVPVGRRWIRLALAARASRGRR